MYPMFLRSSCIQCCQNKPWINLSPTLTQFNVRKPSKRLTNHALRICRGQYIKSYLALEDSTCLIYLDPILYKNLSTYHFCLSSTAQTTITTPFECFDLHTTSSICPTCTNLYQRAIIPLHHISLSIGLSYTNL